MSNSDPQKIFIRYVNKSISSSSTSSIPSGLKPMPISAVADSRFEIIEAFLKTRNYIPKTTQNYRRILQDFVLSITVPFNEITADTVEEYISSKDSYSNTVGEQKTPALKSFFAWLKVTHPGIKSAKYSTVIGPCLETIKDFSNACSTEPRVVYYTQVLKDFVLDVSVPYSRITADVVESYILDKSGGSKFHLDLMISAFKLFFDWLESNHSAIVDQNPTTSIELSNLLALNSALRPREVSQLWDAILTQGADELVIARDAALLTCIGRGLTAQEIQNANVQDLNNKDNRRSSLRVRNSEDWFSREVLLSRSNQEAFEFYIQLRSQNKRRLNLTSQSPLLVSYNERTYGHRLNYVEIVGTIKHWEELSTISNLNLQRLRNTFSTQPVFSFLGQECQGRDLSVFLPPDHEAYFKAIGEEPPGVGIEEFLQSVYR